MSDFERYGEYNEYDSFEKGQKSATFLLIKIVIALACIAVVGVLGTRIFLFNYYPKDMKKLSFTDTLTQYYNSTDGNMNVLTQDYPYMYDDADEGNFFGGNVLVIRDAGVLQFTVRYNNSVFEKLKAKHGADITTEDLIFTLECNPEGDGKTVRRIGVLELNETESVAMYGYHKLSFKDIDFGDGDDEIKWIRLNITFNGAKLDKDEYLIPVYHNHKEYSKFEEYKVGKNEVPKND